MPRSARASGSNRPCAGLSVGLGLAPPELDVASARKLGLSYSPAAATEVLSSIAGGMIAFAGFVFAIVLLLVQFGSAQYSPRLLRSFSQDPVPKSRSARSSAPSPIR